VGYGGAYQYSVWNHAPNIFDFYTNTTVIDWYLNNVETIVTRVNSITGVAYRDDPAIFAWDLINEPHVPGDDSGDILTVRSAPFWLKICLNCPYLRISLCCTAFAIPLSSRVNPNF
jgi:endo-1,4-beta-mannosidase